MRCLSLLFLIFIMLYVYFSCQLTAIKVLFFVSIYTIQRHEMKGRQKAVKLELIPELKNIL